jgi:hypothetical protein
LSQGQWTGGQGEPVGREKPVAVTLISRGAGCSAVALSHSFYSAAGAASPHSLYRAEMRPPVYGGRAHAGCRSPRNGVTLPLIVKARRGRLWGNQPQPPRYTASRQRFVRAASEVRYHRVSRAASNHTQTLITFAYRGPAVQLPQPPHRSRKWTTEDREPGERAPLHGTKDSGGKTAVRLNALQHRLFARHVRPPMTGRCYRYVDAFGAWHGRRLRFHGVCTRRRTGSHGKVRTDLSPLGTIEEPLADLFVGPSVLRPRAEPHSALARAEKFSNCSASASSRLAASR